MLYCCLRKFRRLVRAEGSNGEIEVTKAFNSIVQGFSHDRQVNTATPKRRSRYAVDKMSVSSLRSFEYLEGLPGTTFKRLYKQPSTALAIFRRMLPHLGML